MRISDLTVRNVARGLLTALELVAPLVFFGGLLLNFPKSGQFHIRWALFILNFLLRILLLVVINDAGYLNLFRHLFRLFAVDFNTLATGFNRQYKQQ